MPFTMDDLFKKDVWLPGGDVVEGAIAERGADPGPQAPREVDAPPPRSAPIVPVARTAPRQAPAQDGGGQTFDVRRALSSLFGGQGAVSDYDRQRLAEMSARAKAKTDAEEMGFKRRKDAREERALNATLPEKVNKLRAETSSIDTQTQAKSMSIAKSPESAAMRDAAVTGLLMQSQRLKSGGIDDGNVTLLKNAADNIRGNSNLSGAAVMQILGGLGKIGDGIMRDGTAAAAAASKAADKANDNAREWSTLAEQKRHNEATENNKTIQIEDKNQGKQEKLNEKIEDLGGIEENAKEIGALKKDVDTGWLSSKVAHARQVLGIPDKKYDRMESLLGAINNEITLLRSGKAVTEHEEVRLKKELASMDQNDPLFDERFRAFTERIAMLKRRATNQYQRHGGGGTIDKSNTAREATKQPLAQTLEEQGADPQLAAKIARAKEISADPNESPAKKAKAEKWLSQHAQ